MSLDPTRVLSRAQSAALDLMVDTITITRNSAPTTNPDTGVVTPGYTTVYTGAGKIQQRSALARPSSVGEAEVFLSRVEVHLPMTATGVLADDVATVTASPHNPDLVGRVFHIREQVVGTWRSALRFEAMQVTS